MRRVPTQRVLSKGKPLRGQQSRLSTNPIKKPQRLLSKTSEETLAPPIPGLRRPLAGFFVRQEDAIDLAWTHQPLPPLPARRTPSIPMIPLSMCNPVDVVHAMKTK